MNKFLNTKLIRRICLILMIIILILLSIIIVLAANKKKEADNNNTNYEWKPSGKNFDDWTPLSDDASKKDKVINEDVKITNDGYWFFKKYIKGDYSSKEIHEQIYYFLNDSLIEYSKQLKGLDENKLKDYYNKNKEKIAKDCIKISDVNDFTDFAKVIQKIDEKAEVKYSEFDKESIEQKEDCTTAKINVEYTDGTKISLYVKFFLRKTNSNEFYKFAMQ